MHSPTHTTDIGRRHFKLAVLGRLLLFSKYVVFHKSREMIINIYFPTKAMK
jgi:hypothetical protein